MTEVRCLWQRLLSDVSFGRTRGREKEAKRLLVRADLSSRPPFPSKPPLPIPMYRHRAERAEQRPRFCLVGSAMLDRGALGPTQSDARGLATA